MSPGASLPPSTGSFRSINIKRIERGYEFIASSILDLARQHFFREVNVINNDIIDTVQARRECVQAYGKIGLLEAYDQKIADLQQERRQSQLLGQQMFIELSNELPQNGIDGNVDITEGNDNNNNGCN